jgi:hypothetical protein
LRELGGEALEEDGGEAVGGELERGVGDVEGFGGDVAFPEGWEAFFAADAEEGVEGAAVEGGVGGGGEVGLELEADFDDVEGGDYEAAVG